MTDVKQTITETNKKEDNFLDTQVVLNKILDTLKAQNSALNELTKEMAEIKEEQKRLTESNDAETKIVKEVQTHIKIQNNRIEELIKHSCKNAEDVAQLAGIEKSAKRSVEAVNKALIEQGKTNSNFEESLTKVNDEISKIQKSVDHFDTTFNSYKKEIDEEQEAMKKDLSILGKLKKVFE